MALTEQSLAATPLVNRAKIERSVAAMTWAFILAQTNRNSRGQIYKFIAKTPRSKILYWYQFILCSSHQINQRLGSQRFIRGG